MITLNKGDKPQVDEHGKRPHIAQWVRWLSIPIILGWLALTVITNIVVPQVEVVGQAQSVPMAATDAPSSIAMSTIGTTCVRVRGERGEAAENTVMMSACEPEVGRWPNQRRICHAAPISRSVPGCGGRGRPCVDGTAALTFP